MFEQELRWATVEDAIAAESDALVYGDVFARVDENGLAHRIDPATVTPADEREHVTPGVCWCGGRHHSGMASDG